VGEIDLSSKPDLQFLIKEGLDSLVQIKAVKDYLRVTTHCMYPSNGLVTVAVQGGSHSVVVSDDGGALSEVMSAGIRERLSDKQMTGLVAAHGLSVQNGIIASPPVPFDEAHVAILLVANAAKAVAEWHYQHANLKITRDFKKALADVLTGAFKDVLKHKVTIAGANKPHTFPNVINFGDGNRLIIDPVEREQSSISSRVLTHLDVKKRGDQTVGQALVYDDEQDWSPDDLGLLGMADVPVIAFSHSVPALKRMQTIVRVSQ
jgi:hypothetical protein